jgi:hypothetical protein
MTRVNSLFRAFRVWRAEFGVRLRLWRRIHNWPRPCYRYSRKYDRQDAQAHFRMLRVMLRHVKRAA